MSDVFCTGMMTIGGIVGAIATTCAVVTLPLAALIGLVLLGVVAIIGVCTVIYMSMNGKKDEGTYRVSNLTHKPVAV